MATKNSSADKIASSVRDALAGLGDTLQNLSLAAQKVTGRITSAVSAFKFLANALSSAASSAAAFASALKETGQQAGKAAKYMVAAFAGIVVSANQLTSLPLNTLQKSIASVGSEIASFVKLAEPGAFQRFELAINDLYASIGIALVPVLNKATAIFRTIGSTIYSLTANGQKAIQVLAAMSVSFVTLGAAVAGIAAISVVGAVGLTAFAAAMAIVEAVATGGIGPILSAIGYSLAAVGTAGAALGGVLATLSGIVIAVTGVVSDLQPVLDIFSTAFTSFMDDLGAAFSSFANSTFLTGLAKILGQITTALGAFIKELAPAFSDLLDIFGEFVPTIGLVIKVLGEITAVPFILLAKAFRIVAPMLQAFASAFNTIFTEVGAALFDFVKLMAEVAVEILVSNPAFQATIGILKQLGIVMAGFALAVADVIKDVVGWVRALFGLRAIEEPKAKPPEKDNTGAAATSVSTGDPRDALRKAREAAFQLGTGEAKPDAQTAKNTGEIAKSIQEMREAIKLQIDKIVKGVENFPTEVKNFVIEVANEFVKGVEKLIPSNPFKSGAETGKGIVDNIKNNPLGGAIEKQLERLLPNAIVPGAGLIPGLFK